jgi:serine/threonine protein kinase
MGEVFKAQSLGVDGFERIVAIKRVLPDLAEDREFVTMLVDEARIAAQFTHPNIVQIYELGKCDDTYYIAMEYVPGRDLMRILDLLKRQNERMAAAQACYIASRICLALDYAHRRTDPSGKALEVVHRDVSPSNVLVSYDGEVKLCDFGIVKAATRASQTRVGVLKGKIPYLSPEQVSSRAGAVDRRSDLFAAGVVLCEMLTSKHPFLKETEAGTLDAIHSADFPAHSLDEADVPPPIQGIVKRLLARDPKDRYQWASEACEDLLDVAMTGGRPFHARHLRTWIQAEFPGEPGPLEDPTIAIPDMLTGPIEIITGISSGKAALLDAFDAQKSDSTPMPAVPTPPKPPDDLDTAATVEMKSSLYEPPKKPPRNWLVPVAAALIFVTMVPITCLVSQGWDPASLEVDTSPVQGAEVALDGETAPAKTPVTFRPLAPGVHTLELRAAGYETVHETLKIVPNRVHVLRVRLTPLP